MNFVYVLKSENDNIRYIGLTNNLDRRLTEHNHGKVKSTKSRLSFKLVYLEEFESRSEAALREKFFKTGSGREFLKSINI